MRVTFCSQLQMPTQLHAYLSNEIWEHHTWYLIPSVLVWFLLLWLNTLNKSNLERKRSYILEDEVPYQRKPGQEPGGRNGGRAMEECCLLACFLWFSRLFSYPAWIHLPRDWIAHCRLGPPTPINNQENALQTCCSQVMSLWRQFFSQGFLFPGEFSFFKVERN